MNAVEWYYARENKQTGPVSSLELKRLAAAGQLGPDDLVWREGMTEWALASNVRGLFDADGKPSDSGVKLGGPGAAAAPAATAPTSVAPATAASPASSVAEPPAGTHLFDLVIARFRSWCDAARLDRIARGFRICGSYGLLAAILLMAVFGAIVAVKGSPSALLECAVWMLAFSALHYVAGRSCDALDRLGRGPGGSLASSAIPDCAAVVSKLAAAVTLLAAIVLALQVQTANSYGIVLFGIAAFVTLTYLSMLAVSPTALAMTIDAKTTAGEEAVGVLVFVARAMARLAPVAFGAGVVCGALLLAFACGQIFSGDKGPQLAAGTATVACNFILRNALVPFGVYLAYLFCRLVFDLIQAVLKRE